MTTQSHPEDRTAAGSPPPLPSSSASLLRHRRQRQRAPPRHRRRAARLVAEGQQPHRAAWSRWPSPSRPPCCSRSSPATSCCAPATAARRWSRSRGRWSTAFTVTLLVSAALRGVIGHLVNVEDEPLPGLDVLDYSTALNYTVLERRRHDLLRAERPGPRWPGGAHRDPGPLARHREPRPRRRGARRGRRDCSARSRCRSRSCGRCAPRSRSLRAPAVRGRRTETREPVGTMTA